MNIGRLSNDDGEGNENTPGYQNEMCAFFKNFSAFISVNSLKMESWGRICSCVYTSSKHHCKRNFTVVFIQVVQKSALDMQNLLFFIYLLVLLPLLSPSPSVWLPGFINVCKRLWIRTHFSKNATIFSLVRYICYSRFGPLINCFVSPETEIWAERQKKVLCFRKKKYFKETNRVKWIEANCALK